MSKEDYQEDDFELVSQVQSGNIKVFENLVNKYQDAIALQMRRFSRDLHDIEDLTQQVFINAYTSIHNYKPHSPFINWLKTIASRTGYNFWRKKSKTPILVDIEEWDGAFSTPDDCEISPEYAEIQLESLLLKLLPNERHVIYLIYLDGMTIKSVSETTGWSEGKIKMLAHRGRKKLKELILESRRVDKNG